MGSCHIQIKGLTYLATPTQRLVSMSHGENDALEGETLLKEIAQKTKQFFQNQTPTIQAWRKMMIWDERDLRDFHYPDSYWFKSLANNWNTTKKC